VAVSNQASIGLYWLIWLALVLIPSDVFGKGANRDLNHDSK